MPSVGNADSGALAAFGQWICECELPAWGGHGVRPRPGDPMSLLVLMSSLREVSAGIRGMGGKQPFHTAPPPTDMNPRTWAGVAGAGGPA